MEEQGGHDGIAIIGFAGRFPGAPDVDTLWSNLCAGVESVRSFDDQTLRASGADPTEPGFVNAGGPVTDMDRFDAGFFGMNRREAELTDPQHRVLLEAAWATLEHAGYDPADADRRIGLFGGVATNTYYRHNLLAHPDLLARVGEYPLMLAVEREYAITRAAFKLGLEGPAVSINTACSTSAVALHLAVQSLLAGESDLALAGGAHIRLPDTAGYVHEEGSISSADGHVRAFDAGANGTVMTSGVVFVALKRLVEALDDGDTVYAVVRGSAINNDGANRIGFTAPSVRGQAAVIEEALAVANVDARTIGLLEAHGTGTSLGDPIEVEALTRAFRGHTAERQFCALGSLKSNIGHIDAGAGVAGVIKAALSLYHERIPPSINYHTPNPQIDFQASPFYVNTELHEWPRTEQPRRAGISSFGFGGTNAHIVLEEAPLPDAEPAVPGDRPLILPLSGKTPAALERRQLALADHLDQQPETDLADVAYTLAVGRSAMACRSAVVVNDSCGAVDQLRRAEVVAGPDDGLAYETAEVAFLFTGQGAQYVGMGAGLYRTEPQFAEAFDQCAGIAGDVAGLSLFDLVRLDGDDSLAHERVMWTALGQPAILAIQYALARLWASWGVEPSVMIGHSVGELAAACLGGVFSLEDAMRLAVDRGRMMQQLPVGAMTAILADEAVVSSLLGDEVSLAAVNAVGQCVASGPPTAIDALERRVGEIKVPFRRLPTDRAFHSAMMDPVLDPLHALVDDLERGPLRIPVVSTVTGTWVRSDDFGSPTYWRTHARETVRFAEAVGVLLEQRPGAVLVEVGPGETLASLVRQHPELPPDGVVVSSLPHRGSEVDDRRHARRALAEAWTGGARVDWPAVLGGPRHRIPLPTYPFARERYWIEGNGVATAPPSPGNAPVADPHGGLSEPVVSSTVAATAAPATQGDRKQRIADQLCTILADLSGLDAAKLDPTATFTELGFDSLLLTQANSRFRKLFKLKLTLGQLLNETPTVESLTAHIDGELPQDASIGTATAVVVAAKEAPAADVARAPEMAGPTAVPMLPNACRYLCERDSAHPEHWNLGVMLVPQQRIDAQTTRRVVAALVRRHDALRLRFARTPAGWASSIAPADEPPSFSVSHLADLPEAELAPIIERRCAQAQTSLDLEHGPLFHVELFDLGERGQRLLVIAHHFVMDQMSWPPFWDDFEAFYQAAEQGVPPKRQVVSTTFAEWARALEEHARSEPLRAAAGTWLGLPWERIAPIPMDHPDGHNTNASAEQVQVILSADETTALFRSTSGVARKADLILSALATTTADWTGSETVIIETMGHGRNDELFEDIDPLETVGFFVSYTPLVLTIPGRGAEASTASLLEQIDGLVGRGLQYDLLRYMSPDETIRQRFGNLPRSPILFNHHGQRDEADELPRGSMFSAAPESIGPTHSPDGIRYYPLAISSEISHGQLYLNFVYSSELHERSTIEAFADGFRRQLASVVDEAME